MKKILICTKHKALAVNVSKWLKKKDCKLYRLVGDADEVKEKLREKIEEFNPEVIITTYLDSIVANEIIINEARAVKKDILAYVFHGHPEVLGDLEGSGEGIRDYKVFPDLYDIFRDIGVTKAA